VASLPLDAKVQLLVQNAAAGDPASFSTVSPEHLEHCLRVNVVAPLALTQGFLPALQAGEGRVLHLGTSVAHQPQEGTLTYGVTKMAFHRLSEPLENPNPNPDQQVRQTRGLPSSGRFLCRYLTVTLNRNPKP
jgi:short-subunit dehydrogenase